MSEKEVDCEEDCEEECEEECDEEFKKESKAFLKKNKNKTTSEISISSFQATTNISNNNYWDPLFIETSIKKTQIKAKKLNIKTKLHTGMKIKNGGNINIAKV